MFLKVKSLSISLVAMLLSGFIAPVNASLIYNAFVNAGSDPIEYRVTIDHDTTNNEFDITYELLASSSFSVGKLTGFFADFGPVNVDELPDPDDGTGPYSASNLGLNNETNPSGTSICSKAFGSINSVSGGGCNSTLNLGTTIIDGVDYAGFLFDVGLGWKINDLSLSPGKGSFSIADIGMDLDDWGAVALRGQATGDGGSGSGSAKEFQLIGTQPPPTGGDQVPEPTSLMLLGLGLLGFVGARRKKS